jgi:hypothetical protein
MRVGGEVGQTTVDADDIFTALTLKPFADVDQVVAILGAAPGDVEAALARCVESDQVADLDGKYGLTGASNELVGAIYASRYGGWRDQPDRVAALDAFEQVNGRLLGVMTDWQTVDVAGSRVPNGHDDADYDERILTRLDKVHAGMERALAPLAAADQLISRFIARLADALQRAEVGRTEYVCDVEVESFHNIWFQLHEHLLRTFGRERSQ